MMRLTIRASVALATLLAISACGKSEAPLTDVDNSMTEMPIDENLPANAGDTVLSPPEPANVAAPVVAPPPAFSDTQQMRDDAEATGMTSRIPSDDAPRPGANETAPVAE